MTAAKTLLELSGADLRPPPLATSTLVIIDAQNEYLDGKLALPGAPPALAALARLLGRARAVAAPVVHVQHRAAQVGCSISTPAAAPSSIRCDRERRGRGAEAAAECLCPDRPRCRAEEVRPPARSSLPAS